MKSVRLFSAAFTLAATTAFSANAQTGPPPSRQPAAPTTPQKTAPASSAVLPETKMAFVNSIAFGDEKSGIARYVGAMKMLEGEFAVRQKELNDMRNRIRTLAEEIDKLSGSAVVDRRTLVAKQDEGERLQRDLKYKKDLADADFAKRYEVVIVPISRDIGKALDQFAAQRGITLILDIDKIAPAIMTVNRNLDVTAAFIADYNSKNPASAAITGGTR